MFSFLDIHIKKRKLEPKRSNIDQGISFQFANVLLNKEITHFIISVLQNDSVSVIFNHPFSKW